MAKNPFNNEPKATEGARDISKLNSIASRRGRAIRDAQAYVRTAGREFGDVKSRVDGLGADAKIPDDLVKDMKTAARKVNNGADGMRYAEGKFGASAKGMFRAMADRIGFDTEKWGSKKIKGGDAGKIVDRALGARASRLERFVSKPLQFGARNPLVALAATATVAAAAVATALRGRTNRQAQEEMPPQAPMAQATTYQISPEEYALMQSRMRAGSDQAMGHADRVMAAKQQPAAAPETLAAL